MLSCEFPALVPGQSSQQQPVFFLAARHAGTAAFCCPRDRSRFLSANLSAQNAATAAFCRKQCHSNSLGSLRPLHSLQSPLERQSRKGKERKNGTERKSRCPHVAAATFWPHQTNLGGKRSRHVARAGDFDGDDDIIEFDAEDAELDEDIEVEELGLDEGILEASLHTELSVTETLGSVEDSSAAAAVPMPVGFRLDTTQFHKIKLYSCDFFIRKVEDEDGDVYDFSEIYVAPVGTASYSIPLLHNSFPKEPVRCTSSEWAYITGKTMPFSTDPYHHSAKEIHEVTKVFLTRHLDDVRLMDPEFVLNFEEIYVLDGQERSVLRADVKMEVPGGRDRNRRKEVLIVRDDGRSFRVVPEGERRHMDDIIAEHHWHNTKGSVDTFLRGFRDYDKSNWF